jgi:hypothetical protein
VFWSAVVNNSQQKIICDVLSFQEMHRHRLEQKLLEQVMSESAHSAQPYAGNACEQSFTLHATRTITHHPSTNNNYDDDAIWGGGV